MAEDQKTYGKPAPAAPVKTRVRALARGYYGGVLRDEGEQFDIEADADLGAWMDPVNRQDAERLANRIEKQRGNRPSPPVSKGVPPTPAMRMK